MTGDRIALGHRMVDGVELEDLVHRQLLAGGDPGFDGSDPRQASASEAIGELVRRVDPLASPFQVAQTVNRLRARMAGLGPLEPLLADPGVTDVLVNGTGAVWVERNGALEVTDLHLDAASVDLVIERILAPLGRRVDPLCPVADARLADGSRVHVIVPPLAVDGPCLTIRRFNRRGVALADMATPAVRRLLTWAVKSRANIVVIGSTGSGKTTLLNALAAGLEPSERVITVEDAAELHFPSDHVIRLETRPASIEGAEAVTARDLVRSALRMRPDRLVIGEVRGGEALDLVQAMNTGHNGSLSTLHANSPTDALSRLETLVLLAGVGLPLPAVRAQLVAAVDLVVQVGRAAGGSRVVEAVGEPDPRSSEEGTPVVRTLVRHGQPLDDPIRPPRDPRLSWPGWMADGHVDQAPAITPAAVEPDGR